MTGISDETDLINHPNRLVNGTWQRPPMAWIQDFSPNKARTVIFPSTDDAEATQLVIELISSTD